MKSTLFLNSAFLLLAACQPKEDSNTVQHNFGNTVSVRSAPLTSCIEQAKRYQKPETSMARAYIEKVVDEVIFRNNETSKTFSGYLERKNFCVGVELSDEVNAFAMSDSGLLVFKLGLLNIMENDAQFAAIVGHELAHVTLNHTTNLPTHTFADKLSENDKLEIEELKEQRLSRYDELTKIGNILDSIYKITAEPTEEDRVLQIKKIIADVLKNKLCNDRCEEFEKNADELIAKIQEINTIDVQHKSIFKKYFTEEELSNKREQDADEIGMEYLARADISLTQGIMAFVQLARSNGRPLHCGQNASRGRESHPVACWRIDNLRQELVKHAEQYNGLMVAKRVDFIGGSADPQTPSLQMVKDKYLPILAKKENLETPFPKETSPGPKVSPVP